ncbi:TIGR04283 family arsenosugar biosynthesis glycosyltransferase [Candidatus Saccharibacteria bacterium]|nr:TIGR04283 family arsenosugar biosynthesis glycosyltransferase [Candidatus Saccharibacteria bacterium]
MVTISVIIPAYNEEANIKELLDTVQMRAIGNHEYIVSVSGTDATASIARRAGARVIQGGLRPVALNVGASVATGEVLYFLHADTLPPQDWDELIIEAYIRGAQSGSFRLKFDSSHILLVYFAWFTRFSWSVARFGDQSLFVSKAIFQEIGGFDKNLQIMEDNEIVRRLKKVSTFVVIPKEVITSARKYHKHGLYRLQFAYIVITVLYYCRVPQDKILVIYQKQLSH